MGKHTFWMASFQHKAKCLLSPQDTKWKDLKFRLGIYETPPNKGLTSPLNCSSTNHMWSEQKFQCAWGWELKQTILKTEVAYTLQKMLMFTPVINFFLK